MNGVLEHESRVSLVLKKVPKLPNAFGEIAYKIVSSPYYVYYYEKGYDVLIELQGNPEIQAITVVDEKMKPLGILIRDEFMATMSRPFVLDMYRYRNIKSLVREVKTYPYYLHIYSLYDELGSVILNKKNEFFVLVDEDGSFAGIFSSQDLLSYIYVMMKKDMTSATEVQRNVVPEEYKFVTGSFFVFAASKPTKEVGGDFYFVKDVGDKIIFALCDVSGKGPSASLITTTLGGFFNAFDFVGGGYDSFLKKLNSYLLSSFQGEKYVTGVFGEVYKESGEVNLWDMGHGYILVKSGKDLSKPVSKSNKPLGIFEDISLESEKIYLKDKDILIAFSDGVVEQRNSNGEFYPEKRFYSILKGTNSPELIKSALWTDIKNFRGKYPQSDDMSILMVQMDNDLKNVLL
jgi:sigma-B regulation protein RsbU (phosphoserine phosphatase)